MRCGRLNVMSVSKIGFIAAMAGGAVWLAKVALIWGNGGTNTGDGLVAVAFFIGFAGLLVALLAGGYSVVTTAPIWLRAVVSVCATLLGLMLFTIMDDAAKGVYSSEGWLRDEIGILITASIALVVGVVGVIRSPEPEPMAPPMGGHRAEH